jgi:hypothetical protein
LNGAANERPLGGLKMSFLKRLDEYKKFFAQTTSDLKLDDKCQALLLTFFRNHQKEMGFGELGREIERIRKGIIDENKEDEEVRKKWFHFGKPTLAKHLHHLEIKGIVESKTVRDRRYTVISPKKYYLTSLLRQIAKDYLTEELGERGAFNFGKMIHNMEDDDVVVTIFLMFGIYGLRALDYTISIESEHPTKYARRIVYNFYDETLKSWRTAIVGSKREGQILKAVDELSNAIDMKGWSKKFL